MTAQQHPAAGDDAAILSKRQTNSQLPVNRLPPEILGEIFVVWLSEWRADMGDRRSRGAGANEAMKLSHVCHLWREVALGLPWLWCDFTITRHDSTEALLCRSQEVPLDIKIRPSSALKEQIQPVLHQLHRIRTLDVDGCRLEPHSFIVGDAAPLLRGLDYKVDLDTERLENSDGDTVLGTPFDHVDMPSLDSLHLDNSRVIWSSSLLKPTLKRLSFSSRQWTRIYTSAHSSMSEVLRALANMPMLEEIDLYRVLPGIASGEPPVRTSPITLTRLKKLDLSGCSATSAAYFLQHLAYPATTHISIHCDSSDEDTLGTLFQVLGANLAGGTALCPAPPLSAVYVGWGGLHAWDADPGPGALSTSSYVPCAPARLSVSHRSRIADVYFEHIADVAPLAAVEALYFAPPFRDGEDPVLFVEPAVMGDVCARMANARVVGVGQHGFGELLVRMRADEREGRLAPGAARDEREDSGGDRTGPVFPALETLILRSVWVRHHARSTKPSTRLRGLRAVLRARAAAGYGLKRLVLLSCVHVVPEDVVFLRGAADAVEWDGERYAGKKGVNEVWRVGADAELDSWTRSALVADAGGGPDSGTSDDEDNGGVDCDDESMYPANVADG